ncbi:hypothetical protein RCL1_005362 [Eukaryota sp. TZLM3-RCL]
MSLKDVVKRRTHKERHQPQHRSRLGLLEKHKDYVLRARDFNRKKEAIIQLERKARDRNPDEFAFGMVKSKTIKGVHHTPRHIFSKEEVLAMKDADLPYVLRRLAVEKRTLERLETQKNGPTKAKKIYFVDSDSEIPQDMETDSQSNSSNHSDCDDVIISSEVSINDEIESTRERISKLKLMARELHLQRELMRNSQAKKSVEGHNDLPVYKWKQKRQK